jgi:hypothetical protein
MSDMRFIDPMSVSFQTKKKGTWVNINNSMKGIYFFRI